MSNCELIELKDLTLVDGIELAPPPPPAPTAPRTPRQGRAAERPILGAVVRLVGDSVRVEEPAWFSGQPAEGHDFQPCSQAHLSWCDLCGEFIWGLYKPSMRCVNCQYTCHYRCQPFIQLDCCSHSSAFFDQSDLSEETIETDTNVDEQIEWGKKELTATDIQKKVKEYNAQINGNLFMVLNRDGSYTGFIKVQFKLSRPVSLPPPRRSCSTHDGSWQESEGTTRRTSFYLPKDAAKQLHISSRTRAREVIEALLNKFTVVDNPAKFALFERAERQNTVYLRKLTDDECPLRLRLCAGPSEKSLSLVLRENETGEVNWDAFTMPELHNFLRILQREEEEYVRQIVRRYALARERMKEALTNITAPG
ncbi:ras association domain-containing protein 1 [Clupea harengus]|uniref:Ras association domain-containing protein 1 n=1 Tax=Clupea harengus TaxID=7950 RepID=A0A6P3W0Z1_CLUHA|nr:ras association domain-containing protein 1 [Clupea harengus]